MSGAAGEGTVVREIRCSRTATGGEPIGTGSFLGRIEAREQRGPSMRVKPSALTAIAAILGYMVVVFAVWAITGLEYDEVGDTVENVQKGIVLVDRPRRRLPGHRRRRSSAGGSPPSTSRARSAADGCGSSRRCSSSAPSPTWPPRSGARSTASPATPLWLAIGTLLVGFSEELLTRGLAIVGGRGSMHEKWVWVFSGVIFGLLHAPNALFGQSVGRHARSRSCSRSASASRTT